MTTVYFVRHAQPNFDNHVDELRELTEKGLKDRSFVTEFLKDKDIHAMLSSPYKRSVDTIKEFADLHQHDIALIEDFRERKVDSVWIEDFVGFSKQQWADFNYKLSDGECLREVQERNIKALKEVVSQYDGKNVVIGSHGTALSTIIQYYQPDFGYTDFEKIKKLMPWVVVFKFEGEALESIEMIDVFKANS